MSMRKHFFLFPLIVFVALLFFSITTNEASPQQEPIPPEIINQFIELIQAGPGVEDPHLKKQKLAAKIIGDYSDLETLFKNKEKNMGKNMAKILGKKAILVVGSDVHRGKQEITDFWNGIKHDYQTVEFTLEWAFIVFEEMETEEMEDYDYIAYEYFTFTLLNRKEGEILKNQNGGGERSCRHTQICDCITR